MRCEKADSQEERGKLTTACSTSSLPPSAEAPPFEDFFPLDEDMAAVAGGQAGSGKCKIGREGSKSRPE